LILSGDPAAVAAAAVAAAGGGRDEVWERGGGALEGKLWKKMKEINVPSNVQNINNGPYVQKINNTPWNLSLTIKLPSSVADPDPGSGFWPLEQGSGMNTPDLIFENLVSFFWVTNI
jgi:hypothetical protein